MKKVLSVVLALVLMLSAVSMMAVAAQEVDFTMTIGETKTVYLPGAVYENFAIVKFVAPGNGKVVISSKGNYITCDLVLGVYKNAISGKDAVRYGEFEGNGVTNHDFRYELDCEAGATYYLTMHNEMSNGADNWKVSIECLHETYVDGKCVTCLSTCTHEKTSRIEGLKSCACGQAFDGTDIAVDARTQLASKTNRVWFRFIPDETVPYILRSENPDNPNTWLKDTADPNFVIVDREGKQVIAKDANINALNKNFNFPFILEKGETYFIGLKAEKANADDWYFTILKGTSHIVDVEVQKEVIITNEDGTTSTEIVTEIVQEKHDYDYLPHVDATCQNSGHTPSVVCNKCNEIIAGGDIIPQEAECKDDDNNNYCDWCNKMINEPEDPTKDCSCNCHKTGISKFFFDFALFFQRIFGLNGVCKCGVRHW